VRNTLHPDFLSVLESPPDDDHPSRAYILAKEPFLRTLCLERKRTERSHRRFVLMLLQSDSLLKAADNDGAFEKVLNALSRSTRETDIKGWYEEGCVMGVIFTEIGAAEGKSVANALLNKVTSALCGTLSIEQINEVSLSFHVFPEDWDKQNGGGQADSTLYPDVAGNGNSKRFSRLMKRSMDIAGSVLALTTLSPLLLLISLIIKLTSRGPVLFRQVRVGQYGKTFTFLKFRSMYFASDHAVHKEYVKEFISGSGDSGQVQHNGRAVFKLTRDPRITPLGRLLRKTSLDELPQLLNVLNGEMSLVGPRPPIPYELECYDIWHNCRLLAVKPGITGLWQVRGRSRVKFDEMVRLDLRYATSWSLWLDVKILLQTPKAVLTGDGAV
jgi:lipopolysaccharide/colanic/teichoic acid biosynthesis glycosyltransferase